MDMQSWELVVIFEGIVLVESLWGHWAVFLICNTINYGYSCFSDVLFVYLFLNPKELLGEIQYLALETWMHCGDCYCALPFQICSVF